MNKSILLFLLIVTNLITGGCGSREADFSPSRTDALAVVIYSDKERDQLSTRDQRELQRVIDWMDRDIIDSLRRFGFEMAPLTDIKNYSSGMGPLFIINVEFFNPGVTSDLPKGRMGSRVSSLDLSYRLLDERGYLLAEWQDGAHSIKGGTYCARTLNRRATQKILELFPSR